MTRCPECEIDFLVDDAASERDGSHHSVARHTATQHQSIRPGPSQPTTIAAAGQSRQPGPDTPACLPSLADLRCGPGSAADACLAAMHTAPDTRSPCPICRTAARFGSLLLSVSPAHGVDRAEENVSRRYDSCGSERRCRTEKPPRTNDIPKSCPEPEGQRKKKYRPSLICRVRERLSRL